VETTPAVDPGELRAVSERLLVPNFPPDELVDTAELAAGVAAGTTEVLVTRDGARPVAVAVGDVFAAARVVLLSYLATDAAARSGGIGRRLLDAALARWTARHDPCLVLAEVEDPAHHLRTRFGDPDARLRFYARSGAEVLDLPYLQPRLRPSGARVPHLLLVALHVAPSLRPGPHAVDGALVRRFLEELFVAGEGRPPEDPVGRRLLEAATGAVPTRRLPVG
jgi:GNAT superfamily N-acetyltransferase